MLVSSLNILFEVLQMDTGLHFLHSLHRGALAAYQGGTDPIDIKRHGLSDLRAFWIYVTSTCVAASTVAAVLAASMN